MRPLELRPAAVRAVRLAAQNLTDATPASSLVDAAAVCGLPDAPPNSAAISLAARVPDARPKSVADALRDQRSLSIVLSRRGIRYVVPSADLAVFTLGLLPDDEESWRAAMPGFVTHLGTVGMDATEIVPLVADAAADALADRPLTKRELVDELIPHMPLSMKRWLEPETLASLTALLLRAASLYGGFVLTPATDGEASFVRTAEWLGAPVQADAGACRIEMVRRYLGAYGPSLPTAYAEWAGISERQAKDAFQAIADETFPVRVEGADGWCLREWEELLQSPPPAQGVRLLPPGDAYLASMDRRVIIPEARNHQAIWRSPGHPGVVLVGDELAGVWRVKKAGQKLTLDVSEFRTLPAVALREIEVQARRLAGFKGVRQMQVRVSR